MAAIEITVDLLRSSVPAACYAEGQTISATIVQIEGLEALEMTIISIVTGDGDTDEVILSYDSTHLPSGVELEQCNLASFQCICDCCAERVCYEVVGPLDDVLAGLYHVGFLPGDTQVDQIRFYSPSPGDDPISVTMRVNGELLFSAEIENLSIIDRQQFASDFADGRLPADAELTLEISDPQMYTYNVWRGLTVCLLGLKYTQVVVQASFDFVVNSFIDLIAAPVGSKFYQYPFIYEKTSFQIVQIAPNTTFTPPV